MKKILARGGIEFIAVLLGISGSLWIDNNKDTKEVNYQIERSLHALKETLKSDSKTLEKYILNFENKIAKEVEYWIEKEFLSFLKKQVLGF